MGYLDEIPELFTPKPKKYKATENFESLQNEGHEIVPEDFNDSPFADRVEEKEEEDI